MSDPSYEEHRKALEDSFFQKQEKEAIERLREKKKAAARKDQIRDATGISDDAVLDQLAELEFDAHTLSALSLVPLVQVAWADGRIQDEEREAILEGAKGTGMATSGTSYQMLEKWLEEQPEPELFEAWKGYVKSLSKETRAALAPGILGRTRDVAKSAGGFLGRLTVSSDEKKVLEQVEKSLS